MAFRSHSSIVLPEILFQHRLQHEAKYDGRDRKINPQENCAGSADAAPLISSDGSMPDHIHRASACPQKSYPQRLNTSKHLD
jgi:hypothetical protein